MNAMVLMKDLVLMNWTRALEHLAMRSELGQCYRSTVFSLKAFNNKDLKKKKNSPTSCLVLGFLSLQLWPWSRNENVLFVSSTFPSSKSK